jgi:hypothetical protein
MRERPVVGPDGQRVPAATSTAGRLNQGNRCWPPNHTNHTYPTDHISINSHFIHNQHFRTVGTRILNYPITVYERGVLGDWAVART